MNMRTQPFKNKQSLAMFVTGLALQFVGISHVLPETIRPWTLIVGTLLTFLSLRDKLVAPSRVDYALAAAAALLAIAMAFDDGTQPAFRYVRWAFVAVAVALMGNALLGFARATTSGVSQLRALQQTGHDSANRK